MISRRCSITPFLGGHPRTRYLFLLTYLYKVYFAFLATMRGRYTNHTMRSPSPTEDRADSWATLLELLYESPPDEPRERSPFIYHGLSNREYRLTTSLCRFVGESGEWDMELQLLRDFNKYATDFDEPESVWHLLSIAQHHGLPTRLLDWTRSPLVAAYFATGGSPATDGVIWMVDYRRAHDKLPATLQAIRERESTDVFDIDVLADIEFEIEYETGVAAPINPVNGQRHQSEVFHLRTIREALEAFDSHHEGVCVLFFEPPAIDDRIVNQSALFSMLSDPSLPLDEWLERDPTQYRKVIVPAELKAEIREKLDRANINQRVLFPGLDGLTGWLREYHAVG